MLLSVLLLAGLGLQPPHPSDPRAVSAAIDEVRAGLASLGNPLEIVEIIEGLEGRYGAFADLDGDGDLDYVATEMSHKREQVALHLQLPEHRWRQSSVRSKPFRARHPLVPWVLRNDGSGKAAVLLPTGWPPYLYWLPTDGAGRFRGEAIPLESALPVRAHKSGGVDDMPYEITSVLSAGKEHEARILGTMLENGTPDRFAQWQVVLSADHPSGRAMFGPEPGSDVDWDRLPDRVRPVEQPQCDVPGHDSLTRRSIMGSRRLDLDGDGIADLVHFSADFAAHVFLGQRDSESGLIVYPEELPGAEPLPIEDAWLWFYDRLESYSDEGGYATNAYEVLEKIDFAIETRESGDARIIMYSNSRKSWLVEYFWTGEALIPLIWYRTSNPEYRFPEQGGWFQKPRVQLNDDWDRDGAIDTLLAAPFRAMRWKGARPKVSGLLSFISEGVDFEFLEPYRYVFVYLPGAAHKPRVSLGAAPKATGVPEDRHKGLPLELQSVPVFRNDTIVEHRICLYFRSLKLGIFLAPTDRTGSDSARFETWKRRGEQAFVLDRYFLECDARLHADAAGANVACVPSGERTPRGHQRALWFFEQALPLAHTEAQQAELHHLVARCHSRCHDLAGALESYAAYVSTSLTIEPLNSAHADLTWLFSQPKFRDWHAWRSRHMETRKRSDQDPPGRENESPDQN